MKAKLLSFILIAVNVCLADEDDNCPEIITRSQWTNVQATDVNYLIIPVPYVIIHHTASPECSTRSSCSSRVENIRSYHMDDLGWTDVGFSFFIGGDGRVYEGCGWTREGAHTYGYNKKSVGIAFIGNFQEKNATDRMIEAAHKLIRCGKAQGKLRQNVRVLGGRQVTSTASPGFQLFTQIQNWTEWASNP